MTTRKSLTLRKDISINAYLRDFITTMHFLMYKRCGELHLKTNILIFFKKHDIIMVSL